MAGMVDRINAAAAGTVKNAQSGGQKKAEKTAVIQNRDFESVTVKVGDVVDGVKITKIENGVPYGKRYYEEFMGELPSKFNKDRWAIDISKIKQGSIFGKFEVTGIKGDRIVGIIKNVDCAMINIPVQIDSATSNPYLLLDLSNINLQTMSQIFVAEIECDTRKSSSCSEKYGGGDIRLFFEETFFKSDLVLSKIVNDLGQSWIYFRDDTGKRIGIADTVHNSKRWSIFLEKLQSRPEIKNALISLSVECHKSFSGIRKQARDKDSERYEAIEKSGRRVNREESEKLQKLYFDEAREAVHKLQEEYYPKFEALLRQIGYEDAPFAAPAKPSRGRRKAKGKLQEFKEAAANGAGTAETTEGKKGETAKRMRRAQTDVTTVKTEVPRARDAKPVEVEVPKIDVKRLPKVRG